MTDHTASTDTVDNKPSPPKVTVAAHLAQAHYYTIADASGMPRAALNVVLNAQMHVLHSELWLYDRFNMSEALQADIYNCAKKILETDYLGAVYKDNFFLSEIRVIDGRLLGDEPVEHRNPDARYRAESRHHIWPYATAYAATVLVLLFFLLLNNTVLRPNQPATATADNAQPVTLRSAAESDAPAGEDTAPAEESMPAADTNGLPPSIKADNRLAVGMTARILPGYRSFVRSEPGPDAGEPVGVLENGATARLLGGPVWKEGNTDTIVWWYVETATGVRGWTPANTSELTLLEPAE